MINGLTLRAARKKLKLSQTELGQVCGLSGRVISNLERDKRSLDQQEEEAIRRYFTEQDVDLSLFKGGQTSQHKVMIVIEKVFPEINVNSITEIAQLIESIKGLLQSQGWEVSCKLKPSA